MHCVFMLCVFAVEVITANIGLSWHGQVLVSCYATSA